MKFKKRKLKATKRQFLLRISNLNFLATWHFLYITSMAEIQSVSVLFAKQMTYYRKGFAFLYVNCFSWKAYPEKQMFCPQSPLLSIFRNSLKRNTHTLASKLIFQQQLFGKWHSDFSLAFQLVLPTSIIYVFCKGLLFQTRNMYLLQPIVFQWQIEIAISSSKELKNMLMISR